MVHLIAAVIIRNKGLGAVAAPFHRIVERARGEGHRYGLGIHFAADAEAAAGVVRDDAHLVHRQFQQVLRKRRLQAPPALARRIDRERALRLVPQGGDHARLHRACDEPVVHEIDADALRRFGELRLHVGLVAIFPVHDDVGAELRPHHRRVRLRGARGVGDGGQGVEIKHDRLGGVARLMVAAGHHHGEALAHEARLRGGEDLPARLVHRLAGAVDVIGVVDEAAHAGGFKVGARVDGDHARRFFRGGDVDAEDFRVRMGRAHEGGVELAFEIQVVGEFPAAGEKPRVFLAPNRLADPELPHSIPPRDCVRRCAFKPRRAVRRKRGARAAKGRA